MENLTQQAAAWLAGVSARTLRDYSDLRRSADGTYDAREVLVWSARRVPHPDFDDEQIERLMLASEFLYGVAGGDVELLTILDELKSVREKYGDAGLAEFAKLLMREWSISIEPYRQKAMAGESEDDARQLREEAKARAEFRISVVCEKCGKLRKGRTWINASPPAGYLKMFGFCPEHSRKKTAPAQTKR